MCNHIKKGGADGSLPGPSILVMLGTKTKWFGEERGFYTHTTKMLLDPNMRQVVCK